VWTVPIVSTVSTAATGRVAGTRRIGCLQTQRISESTTKEEEELDQRQQVLMVYVESKKNQQRRVKGGRLNWMSITKVDDSASSDEHVAAGEPYWLHPRQSS
jgi:hypothetical protein